MWKSLISSGQQATRTSRHIRPAAGLWKPPVSAMPRETFTTAPLRQKEGGQSTDPNDRESLNPERSEVTQSGTDSEVAHHPSAYDPSNTAPESELEETGKETQQEGKASNPLNVSPANQGVSAWKNQAESGPERNADRGVSSGKGSPKKNRSIHVKEDGTHVSYKD